MGSTVVQYVPLKPAPGNQQTWYISTHTLTLARTKYRSIDCGSTDPSYTLYPGTYVIYTIDQLSFLLCDKVFHFGNLVYELRWPGLVRSLSLPCSFAAILEYYIYPRVD